MKKILFNLLMVLGIPSVYSQVINYKGIPVKGSFNTFKAQLEHRGIKYSTTKDECHIFYTNKTTIRVLEDFHTHKVWAVCERFKFDSFIEARDKFIRVHDAISYNKSYECLKDYYIIDGDQKTSRITENRIYKIEVMLGSSYQYMYGLKKRENMAIGTTLSMEGTYYIVSVMYCNGDNHVIVKEEF